MALLWKKFIRYIIIIAAVIGLLSTFIIRNIQEHNLAQKREALLVTTVLVSDILLGEGTTAVSAGLGSPEQLEYRLRELATKSNIRLLVAELSGRIIADSFEGAAGADISANPEFQEAIVGREGFAVRPHGDDGHETLFAALAMRGAGNEPIAVLMASVPLAYPLDMAKVIRNNIMTGAAAIALLVFFITMASARRYSRSLESVVKVTEQLSAGNFDVDIPLKHKGRERGKLGMALSSMAEKLKALFTEVEFKKSQLEATLEAMTEGVMAVSADGTVIQINDSFVTMFSVEGESLGKPYWEVVRNTDVTHLLARVIETKEGATREITLVYPTARSYIAKAQPLHEPALGAIVVLFEITELKMLSKIKADFVANVSHELRTPLTAMKGYIETLEEGAYESEDDLKRFLGIISRHIGRLINIVNDLLVLSELEAVPSLWSDLEGKEFEGVELAHVIRASLDALRTKAESRQLSINVDMMEGPTTCRGDAFLLEQLFINLLDNAIKYTPQGKGLSIRLYARDAELVAEVRDGGIGIAPEHLPRLFERFYRVDKTRSSKLEGTGLGLSIVKHIALLHGGNVDVTSSPGEGSTFTVTIPRAAGGV